MMKRVEFEEANRNSMMMMRKNRFFSSCSFSFSLLQRLRLSRVKWGRERKE
jgi:hypothetical protein